MIGPAGQWLGASILLGRPVQVTERYPHVCGITMTGLMTGVAFRTERRDCAACAQVRAPARQG